jgi:predicted nucleotidyltransferase
MAQKTGTETIYAALEKTLQNFFLTRSEVLLAYIFGSYLDKSKLRFDDIDIAVLVRQERIDTLNKKMPYGYEAAMITELSHLLKYPAVDLAVLNLGSPLLQHQVITRGKLIFCRSELERIRFETYALRRYADTMHLRKIKRSYMKKRIEKGLEAYVGSAGN